jgi:hypothetical protein
MVRNALLLSAALTLAGLPVPVGTGIASAGSIKFFNNFPYNQYYYWYVCGETACGGLTYSPALQFIPATSGTTTKISVPISSYSDYTSDVRVILRADKNGLPGAVLAKRNVSAPACCVTTTVKMTVSLTADEPYWLEVAPRTSNDRAVWEISDSTDECTVAEDYYGSGWSSSSITSCPAGKIVGE